MKFGIYFKLSRQFLYFSLRREANKDKIKNHLPDSCWTQNDLIV